MICTECYEADNQLSSHEITLATKEGQKLVSVACDRCPACDAVSYSQDQADAINRLRLQLLES